MGEITDHEMTNISNKLKKSCCGSFTDPQLSHILTTQIKYKT